MSVDVRGLVDFEERTFHGMDSMASPVISQPPEPKSRRVKEEDEGCTSRPSTAGASNKKVRGSNRKDIGVVLKRRLHIAYLPIPYSI